MDNFLDLLARLAPDLTIAALALLVSSVMARGIIPILVWLPRALALHQLKSVDVANEASPARDMELDTRLNEAHEVLRGLDARARWNKWSMHSLAFCQYIVGGVLATSFIQAALSKEMVGLLGVIVLVSSLFFQKFRPDIHYRNARVRAARLRVLIRQAEDDLFAIRSSSPDAKTIQAVRQTITNGLSAIESSELADGPSGNANDLT